MPQVTARPPRFYQLRLALAILLVRWSAGLIAGSINGFRFEAE